MSADGSVTWDEFCEVSRSILAELLDGPVPDFARDDHLLDDVGLDSFGLLLFVGEIEMRFAGEIPPSLEEPTLGRLYHAVQRGLRRAAAGAHEGGEP